MENLLKIVDFGYCSTCKWRDLYEGEDPCNECLNNPVNEDTMKPVNWEERS